MSAVDQPIPAVLGVAGLPDVVAASLSPVMMRAALEHHGITGYYVPLPIREQSAAKALRSLPRLGFRGANVTMPYKQIAAQIAHTRSPFVELVGSANTLIIDQAGHIHAEATDGRAVVDAIEARGISLQGAEVTILGAGGAARQIAFALVSAGVSYLHLWNRTPSRWRDMLGDLHNFAPDLELQVHDQLPIRVPVRVMVSCIPATVIAASEFTDLHADTLIVDLAYRRDGQPTNIVQGRSDQLGTVVNGREVLVRQGAAAFRHWFDLEASIEVMQRAVA